MKKQSFDMFLKNNIKNILGHDLLAYECICLKYGVDGRPLMPMNKIQELFGLEKNAVHIKIQSAFERIRNYCIAKGIDGSFDF